MCGIMKNKNTYILILQKNKKTKRATKKKYYNSLYNMLLYNIYSKVESRGFRSESV